MQLAVLCVVIAYLCIVTATPHGYGAKGGAAAAAKAEAGALAGAYNGGLGALPLGPGFSGSFTKSSSSSSASSSASSSSSSFSYSGSGYIGGGGGCASGICPSSGTHDKNSYSNDGHNGGAINGNQNYNTGFPHNAGAYSGAAAQAGAVAGSGLYFGNNNNAPCTGNNCFDKKDDCKGANCPGSTGDVTSADKNCESGNCFPASSAQPLSIDNNDKKNDCVFGQCDSSYKPGSISTNVNADVDKNQTPGKCQSGNCDTTTDCSGGHCSPSKPNSPSAFGSINSPQSNDATGGAFLPGTQGYNSKPHLDSHLQVSPDHNSPKCTSGQCYPTTAGATVHTSPENDDIPINFQKNADSKSNANSAVDDNKKAIENSKGSSNCANGNCASNPESNGPYSNPGTYPYSSLNVNTETSKCNSPDCKNVIYNHAAASAGASGSAYNKPAIHLTTPKQESSCTTPNCKPGSYVPGHHATGINIPGSISQPNIPSKEIRTPFDCAAGQCGNNQPNSYFPSSSMNSPYPSSSSGSSGPKCTSPNCAPTPYHPSNQNPGSHIPGHQSINNSNKKPFDSQQGSSPNYTPSIYPSDISGYQPNQPQSYSSGQSPNPSKVYESQESFPPYAGLSSPQPCAGIGCSGVPPVKPNYGTAGIGTPSNPHTGFPSSPSLTSYPSSAPTVATAAGAHSIHRPSEDSFPPYAGSPSPCGGNGCTGVLPAKPHFVPNGIAPSSHVHTGLPSLPTYSSLAPSVSTTTGAHSINTNKPSHDSRDKPVYTGGFGGPAGLLKPNDYSLPNAIPAVPNPGVGKEPSVPCSTGNCDSNHVAHASAGAIPAVGPNAAPCTTGKCGPQHGAGTNNYNGPHSSAGSIPPVGPNASPCTSGKCGPQNVAGTNIYNSAHAAAGVNPTVGFNQAPCTTGKCGSQNGAGTNSYNGVHASPGSISTVGPNATPCTTGKCGPESGAGSYNYNGAHSTAGTIPALGSNSVPCTTGKCGSQNGAGSYNYNGAQASTGSIPAIGPNVAPCTTGKCGPQNAAGTNIFNGANAFAGAAASSNAIIYTGGFGGPPGFLKPYDGGNVKGLLASVSDKDTLLYGADGGSTGHGDHSNISGVGNAAQAFASAAAGATAGAFGSPAHYAHNEGSDHKAGRGCGEGCSGNDADGGLNPHHSGGLSLAKAGAISGANAGSFGLGGSYASSSASAHASAGAAVKGYGRR